MMELKNRQHQQHPQNRQQNFHPPLQGGQVGRHHYDNTNNPTSLGFQNTLSASTMVTNPRFPSGQMGGRRNVSMINPKEYREEQTSKKFISQYHLNQNKHIYILAFTNQPSQSNKHLIISDYYYHYSIYSFPYQNNNIISNLLSFTPILTPIPFISFLSYFLIQTILSINSFLLSTENSNRGNIFRFLLFKLFFLNCSPLLDKFLNFKIFIEF